MFAPEGLLFLGGVGPMCGSYKLPAAMAHREPTLRPDVRTVLPRPAFAEPCPLRVWALPMGPRGTDTWTLYVGELKG